MVYPGNVKCTLVTTHTARRTGATLMYPAGIPALSVMKITGHKTEKEFLKYMRLDERPTAEVDRFLDDILQIDHTPPQARQKRERGI